MLEVTIDTAAAEKTVDTLVQNIEGLREAMPQELIDWQREDMNRKQPNLTVVDEYSVMTEIWPRGRFSVQRAHPTRRPGQRKLAAPTVVHKGVVVHSSRPILRPELFDRLVERMSALLKKVVPWA